MHVYYAVQIRSDTAVRFEMHTIPAARTCALLRYCQYDDVFISCAEIIHSLATSTHYLTHGMPADIDISFSRTVLLERPMPRCHVRFLPLPRGCSCSNAFPFQKSPRHGYLMCVQSDRGTEYWREGEGRGWSWCTKGAPMRPAVP